mgnify:FL=1
MMANDTVPTLETLETFPNTTPTDISIDSVKRVRRPPILVLTPEEKLAIGAKIRAAKNANALARKASPLRSDFLDAEYWDELARTRGLRLPPWGKGPTVSNMRHELHRCGMSQAEWEAWFGCKLAASPRLNPLWPLRSFTGLLLEHLEGGKADSTDSGGIKEKAL